MYRSILADGLRKGRKFVEIFLHNIKFIKDNIVTHRDSVLALIGRMHTGVDRLQVCVYATFM